MKHVEKLTSPEMHGRGYVNGGDSIAAEYIAKQFELLGLKKINGSFFQLFSFPVNTFPDSMRVNINGKNLVPGVDYIVDPASHEVQGNFSPVVGGPEILEPKKGIGMFDHDTSYYAVFVDVTKTEKEKIKETEKNIYQNDIANQYPIIKLVNSKFTWSVSTEISHKAVLEIQKKSIDSVIHSVYIHINNRFIEQHKTRNVMGVIKGKNKKAKAIVITAHYDHLGRMGGNTYFPGCNDNASGVAMLLDLAKYYSENKPEQDIYFIAFAGEEAGLIGSRYFVQNPVFSLEKIRFLVNLDLLGTGSEGITVVNATKHEKEFELLKKINTENDFLTAIKPRGEAANSDHYWFSQKGVPAFFIYTLGGAKAYHDVDDKFGSPDFSEFEDVSSLLKKFIQQVSLLK